MKILHVIDSGGFYGAEAMLVELAIEQQNAGHSVTICSIGTPSELEKPIEKVCRERGISVFPLRMKAGLNILGGMEIVRYAKQNGFDLLHSHGYKGNILLGILPRFIRKLPLITTLHGWTSTKRLSKLRLYELLDSIMLERMDGVVFVSEAMKSKKRIANRDFKSTSVIPNGIGEEILIIDNDDAIAEKIEKLRSSGPVIGSIGRLSYEKGYDVLLAAFEDINSRIKNCKLVVLGDGPLKKELEQEAVDLGLSSDVWFAGYIEGANKYIGLFDIYVNSSRTEGTPITLLEAMRAETAVVAANVGGNSALIDSGQCGKVFEKEDSTALAESVCGVLSSQSNKKSIITNAKQKFINEYTSKKMMIRYQNFYKEFVE